MRRRPAVPWRSRSPSPRPWRWSTWCDRWRQKVRRTVSFAFVRGALVFPGGSHHAAVASLLAQVAGKRFRMTVGRDHTAGSSLDDAVEQARPIRMIRQDEPTVVGALSSDTSYAHQTGDEGVGDVAETPHPRGTACRERRQDELTGK